MVLFSVRNRPADRPPDRVNILPEGKAPHVSNSTWCLLGVSMMSRRCLVGVLKVSICVKRILGGCHEGISYVSGRQVCIKDKIRIGHNI